MRKIGSALLYAVDKIDRRREVVRVLSRAEHEADMKAFRDSRSRSPAADAVRAALNVK